MSIIELIEKGAKNRQRRANQKTLKIALMGAAVGLTVGAAAGVLLTPQSGKETREELVGVAKELPEKAKEVFERVKEKVEEVKGKLKETKTTVVADMEG